MTSFAEAISNMAVAFKALTFAIGGPPSEPKTLLETWEAKMSVEQFEVRGLARRARRWERKRGRQMKFMGLLSLVLNILFYISMVVGVVVVIALVISVPLVAGLLGVCVFAGVLAAIIEVRKVQR